jgi:hypothetical protein
VKEISEMIKVLEGLLVKELEGAGMEEELKDFLGGLERECEALSAAAAKLEGFTDDEWQEIARQMQKRA